MSGKRTGKRRIVMAAFVAALLTAVLAVWGCGDGYDTPVSNNSWSGHAQILTATDTALVTPAVVKTWVDNGLVNADRDERVVIVEVGPSAPAWDNLHIPGSQYLYQSSLLTPRVEAVDSNPTMVIPGATMDNLVQAMGIDGRTTVVLSYQKGQSCIYATRAYFTFRYWGFPKERLKMVDGGTGAYEAAFTASAMEGRNGGATALPVITRSTFCVYNNGALRDDLRASLGEMIRAVTDNAANLVVVDARPSYPGFTGVVNSTGVGSAKAVFEGRIRGSKWIPPYDLFNAAVGVVPGFTDNVTYAFKSRAAMEAILAANGIDSTRKVYFSCASGVNASAGFFVLDGIFNLDVVLYDGSWTQWGVMSSNIAKRGSLSYSSPWGVDSLSEAGPVAGPATAVNYLDNASVYTFVPQNQFLPVGDPSMNQIESADKAYIRTAPAGVGGTGATGGSSPGGGGC